MMTDVEYTISTDGQYVRFVDDKIYFCINLSAFDKIIAIEITKEQADGIMFGKIPTLKLEVGEYYEDEKGFVWRVDRWQESYSTAGARYTYFVASNKVSRRFNPDGTMYGEIVDCTNYPPCNLVRKAKKNNIVAGKGISTTLAEELRKTAENYNSIEGQTARLKEKAIEAAKQGAMRIEIDDSVHYNEQLKSALAKDGFTVVSEFMQYPVDPIPSLPRLSKVYLSWGNP